MANLSNLKCLVIDRGLYTYLAQKLGESFGKVYYAVQQSEPYPHSQKSRIGTGLPEIERVRDIWPYIDKVDLVAFFDVYDGALQTWLRSKGYNVFGSGACEKLELDRVFFLATLDKIGLPVPFTQRVKGIQEACSYMEGKSEKYWKCSWHRGDFETKKYENAAQMKPWLQDLKQRLGAGADTVEILIQDPIKSECEAGWDGFVVDGEFCKNAINGYEDKDCCYAGRVLPDAPKPLKSVNDKLAPIFKSMGGYRGHYSSEVRITKGGKLYFLDPCCRAPSPPSALMCEQYTNYSEAVYEVACGRMPELKHKDQFGVQIVMTSEWHDSGENGQELCVQFPDELKPHVKLKNHCKTAKNTYYVVPNSNGAFFGEIVATGSSFKQAQKKALEVAKEIKADGFRVADNMFDFLNDEIVNGRKFGIAL